MHGLATKLGPRGLRVMGVTKVESDGLAEQKQKAASTAKEHHIDYPCLLDTDGAWMTSAGIDGVPAFLVVDRSGKVVFRMRSAAKPGSDGQRELAAAVERAVGSG